MRPPRLRITRKPRRLGCGCHVPAGTTIVTMGKMWLCATHQPWVEGRSHEEILAEYRDRDWEDEADNAADLRKRR